MSLARQFAKIMLVGGYLSYGVDQTAVHNSMGYGEMTSLIERGRITPSCTEGPNQKAALAAGLAGGLSFVQPLAQHYRGQVSLDNGLIRSFSAFVTFPFNGAGQWLGAAKAIKHHCERLNWPDTPPPAFQSDLERHRLNI